MALLQRPGTLTITNGPAPAGAMRLDITEQDLDIAAYMERINFWAGAWQAQYDGPVLSQRVWSGGAERVATAVQPRVDRSSISGRTAWRFEDHAFARLSVPLGTVQPSHTIYAAFQVNSDDDIGLFSNTDGTGARLALRALAAGGARYDHSGSLAADIHTSSGKWEIGTASIIWASYNGLTKLATIGGTADGVVQITSNSTKVLVNDHKGGLGYSIGNVLGFFGPLQMGDVIVTNGDMPGRDPVVHEGIVRSLASKYGLAAA